ncbi:Demethylrebeccamycin-D-glucose O-methyltransferase [Thalassocella blandensis]|nr:Demethylrebeccamycin-D-glucose O-methyltransferase [Thalassocella blandensis]
MLTVDFKKIPIRDHDVLLDLGCGEGRHTIGAAWEKSNIHVIGIDLCFADIATAKSRHEAFDPASAARTLYCQANGFHLPFADNSFDHIICSEVLEHIEAYEQILQEIHRILKPGGSLNISVPRYWPEKICWRLSSAYHQVEGGHIRIFNSRQLRNAIKQMQYRFHGRHWAHALHVPYWWLRCAFWNRGENFLPVRLYHKLLVWDLLKRPWITQFAEKCLNPIMGKSIVMYFSKQAGES